ncbi:MAG: hypothetical protein NC489_22605 [Ruminococcus flavefaciens]|nr:hypothetical protein [Ruminococcus flavefaciens]
MIKIERTFPAPPSLAIEAQKASGKYDKPDVVKQLREDAHDKCYICEMKGLQDPVVEHLLPHKDGKYPDRKFDWNNLFWACGHCNGVKNQQKYDTGVIDCCNQDPEELIDFKLINEDIVVRAKDDTDEKAVLTAMLIREVFNLKNTGMRVYKSEMRFQELNKEMNKLYDNLEELNKNPNSKIVLRKLRAILRRESAFAAFKRNYIRDNKNRFPQLIRYIA